MSSFNEALSQIKDQDVFIYPEPEVLDFTSRKRPAKLIICSKNIKIEVPFGDNDQKVRELLGYLQFFLGGENSLIVGWKIKNFLSYAKARTGHDFKLTGKLYDLSFLENYIGDDQSTPTSFAEAFARLNKICKKTNWPTVNKAYQNVYLPLIKAMPQIESFGLSHRQKRSRVYSYYEIDGQANGRMKCSHALASSFNPHCLTEEDKNNLRLPIVEHKFLVFDFKYMEVSVLQWLSQDDYMGELLTSGKDLYSSIWEAIARQPSNDARRQTCKDLLLPVVFGMGAETLSKRLNWPVDVAKKMIERLGSTLPLAFNWIRKQQELVRDGWAADHFGRMRYFKDDLYKVRNFAIQSPASFICLHKLTCLVEALKDIAQVAMHIHDGYVVAAAPENIHRVYEITKKVLESEHELYSGLKLRLGCLIGRNLSELKPY